MPLPAPSTWDFRANGWELNLFIRSVDGVGNVSAVLDDAAVQNATWNEDTRELAFDRTIGSSAVQHYSGRLFDSVGVSLNTYDFGMAGTFTDFTVEPRFTYGWFALGWMIG
jgi:hypothetical protein